MKLFTLPLLLAAALGAAAQGVFVPGDGAAVSMTLAAANPTGSCDATRRVYNYITGHSWGCVGAPPLVAWAWTDLGGPVSAVSDQFSADMGSNEDHPEGIPPSFGYWSGSYITIGNAFVANSKAATLPWAGLYVGPNGTQSKNTGVQVRNFKVCFLTTSWTCSSYAGSSIQGEYDSEDWGNWIGSATMTANSDGTLTLPMKLGTASCNGTTTYAQKGNCLTHFYGDTRIATGGAAINGVVAYMEARLVQLDKTQPDDRAKASFMCEMGADAYISTVSSEVPPIPAVGGGKFKFVRTDWRSFTMTTMTAAQLIANPPPITVTAAP